MKLSFVQSGRRECWEMVVSKTLLLVDDEPHLLFSLSEYFGRQGYNVLAAESGIEALDILSRAEPDIIVSDIMMEEMDGFELQQRVKALTSASIPFVFLTAKSDREDRVLGLRDGADDYITKPFDPDELEARVATILNRVEITQEKERQTSKQLHDRVLARVADRFERPVDELLDYLNMALDERFGDNVETRRYYLTKALNDVELLDELVQDLSWATSQTQREALNIRHCRIAPVIRAAAASAARLAKGKDIDLQITCGGLLADDIDPQAIERALEKLLESAVRISPEESSVSISARRAKDGGLDLIIVEGAYAPRDIQDPTDQMANAISFAQGVAKGHGGQLYLRKDANGQQSYRIWLPSRRSRRQK